jgi:hypothetical protein
MNDDEEMKGEEEYVGRRMEGRIKITKQRRTITKSIHNTWRISSASFI